MKKRFLNKIVLPNRNFFNSEQEFLAKMLYEIFGSLDYAKEELRAEKIIDRLVKNYGKEL